MTLIILSTPWLIGIAAAHWLHPSLALVGMAAVVPLLAFFLWRDDPKVRRIAACSLFLLLLGSAHHTLSLPDLSEPGHIAAYRDQGEVTLWGRVTGEPDVRDTYTNLRLAVERARIEDEQQLGKGKILVRAPRYLPPRTQRSWRLKGSWRPPLSLESSPAATV